MLFISFWLIARMVADCELYDAYGVVNEVRMTK